jgi:hypothetical protein
MDHRLCLFQGEIASITFFKKTIIVVKRVLRAEMAAAAPPHVGVGDAGTVTLPNSFLIGTGFTRSLVI